MTKRRKILIVGGSVLALAAGGAGMAIATGGGDNESPIPSGDLDKASTAALAHTGGGEVTDTEVGDEESYYEVEVTKDGSQTDVQLDKAFNVVGGESDSDSGEDEGAEDGE